MKMEKWNVKDTSKGRDRIWLHVRSFERALDAYLAKLSRVDHPIPLHRFLTEFFKENRQMGSKDRRSISRFLYHYFRLGHAFAEASPRVRLMLAEFLCSSDSPVLTSADLEQEVQGEYVELVLELRERLNMSLEDKVTWLEEHGSFQLKQVFPWLDRLSEALDPRAFAVQFFVQPHLFLRIRRGQERKVEALLAQHEIRYERVEARILALPNGTALDHIRGLKGLVEVQDLSSQRSLENVTIGPEEFWWDACSGAGGKSLLLLDKFPRTQLLASDFRPSILRNLDERFERAGITAYRRKIIDLNKDTTAILGEAQFDGILMDVPCSGSGTWGRTPEMLQLFHPHAIDQFSKLQYHLVSRALTHLKPGGQLVYVTCSAFHAENEAVVQSLSADHGLEIIRMDYKIGYLRHADTLFVAILKNNS